MRLLTSFAAELFRPPYGVLAGVFAVTIGWTLSIGRPVAAAPALDGAWQISAKQTTSGTCAEGKPGDVNAYIWNVKQRPDGTVRVNARSLDGSETSFPVLDGRLTGSELVLAGAEAQPRYSCSAHADSWLRLVVSGNKIKGTRRFLGIRSTGRGSNVSVPCFVDFDVTGTRITR